MGTPTPSSNYTVADLADLVERVDGRSTGLQLTARKADVPPEELRDGDAAYLKPDWRKQVTIQIMNTAHPLRTSNHGPDESWATPASSVGCFGTHD